MLYFTRHFQLASIAFSPSFDLVATYILGISNSEACFLGIVMCPRTCQSRMDCVYDSGSIDNGAEKLLLLSDVIPTGMSHTAQRITHTFVVMLL